jgi:hypothetical protein
VTYAYVAVSDEIPSTGRVGDDLDAELRHGLQEPESLALGVHGVVLARFPHIHTQSNPRTHKGFHYRVYRC